MSSFLLDEEFLKNEDMDKQEMEEMIGSDFASDLNGQSGFDSMGGVKELPSKFGIISDNDFVSGSLLEDVNSGDVMEKQSRLSGDYSFVRTFNSEEDITKKKGDKDGLMNAVTGNIRDYVTSMGEIKTDNGGIDEEAVTDLVNNKGKQVITACNNYISAKHPILPWGIGKRRKKLVVRLKNEMEKLNPEVEKNVYGYLGRDKSVDNVEVREYTYSETESEDILTGFINPGEGQELSIDQILMMISNGFGGVIDQGNADSFRAENRKNETRRMVQAKDATREKEQKEHRPLNDELRANKDIRNTDINNPGTANSSTMISASDMQNQNKFYTLAQKLGISDAMPLEFNQDKDEEKQKSQRNMEDYYDITDGRELEDIQMSPEAKSQLALIKAIGFIAGIPNWDQVVAPEELMYEQDEKTHSIKSIALQEMPEMGADIGMMTKDDANRFVKQFDRSDAKSISTVERMLSNPLTMRGLANLLGVDPTRLMKRIKTMLLCLQLYNTIGSIAPIPMEMFDQ